LFKVCAVALGVLLAGSGLAGAQEQLRDLVDYPDGYRDWTHVKSMVIQQGHPLFETFGGIHHIYANETAVKALILAMPAPDGAVLVFDLLEAKHDGNAIVEGPRKVVGVMAKNAKKYAATGGWGFEAFKGDSRERVVTDPKTACFDCHAGQLGSDFVHSRYRP
jgi:hypothetical protein